MSATKGKSTGSPADKPVTEYIDYREYLRDYYRFQKENTRHFSHRYFANKAGIKSSSFFIRVMEGRRNLTRPMIEKFIAALKLTAKEALYFKNLVLFNQARTAADKTEHYQVLRSLKGIVKESVVQASQYDYFSHWYVPVLRELVCMPSFDGNFAALAKAVIPPITAKQAKDAVQLLLKLDLVKKTGQGRYSQNQASLAADPSIRSLAVRGYTEAMLKHGLTALNSQAPSVRNISTMTLGVTREQYEVLVEELTAFKERVKQIVTESTQPTQVYELNFALFPVSQNPASEGQA